MKETLMLTRTKIPSQAVSRLQNGLVPNIEEEQQPKMSTRQIPDF